MIYLTFLSAILLSGIAAYYSVLGLALIFAGAFWPVVFMGSALELSKLVTASWLYRNWKTAPFLLRTYLTVAVVILMLLTSMGIFGFLAKSHIDSTIDSGNNTAELKVLNSQEKVAKERLDYLLKRAGDPEKATSGIDRQIQQTQKELADINKKRLPLLKEETKLTADVGPIKYVADMFFEGDGALDKAVRMVIFMIMLVFDPLAVLLLIAGNISLRKQDVETVQEIKTRTIEKEESVEIQKENLASMEESRIESIPEVTQTTVSPTQEIETHETVTVHHEPGVYEESRVPVVTKYDYDDEFAFREKDKLDGGKF